MFKRNSVKSSTQVSPSFKGFKPRGERDMTRKLTFAYTVTPPIKDDIIVGYDSYTPYLIHELTDMFIKRNIGPKTSKDLARRIVNIEMM